MKKFLSIILVAAMIASVMTVSFAVKADEAVQISNADELVAFLTNTENANKDAVLTANIDLSAKSGTNTWKPMANYSGTFDGAGFTVSGLSFTRNVANNAADMINEGDCQDPTDVELNCMGKYSYGLFFINLSGSVKNLKIKDVSLTFNANFNKNYRIDVSALAGYANGAVIENVDMENVDVKTNNTINENQGQLGYGALYVARAAGAVSFKGCESNADCSVNTSAAGRLSAAQMIGCYEGNDSLTFAACASEAFVTVMAKDTAENGNYMWKQNGALYSDGVAGGLYKASSVEVTVVPDEDNVETGDATTALLVVSAVALLGTALVVGKKRRVQE